MPSTKRIRRRNPPIRSPEGAASGPRRAAASRSDGALVRAGGASARAVLATVLLAAVAAGCGAPASGPGWEASLARATAARAETRLAAGDVDGARALAHDALQRAEGAGDSEAAGRALAVLARVDGSPELAARAARLSRDADGPTSTLEEEMALVGAADRLAAGDAHGALVDASAVARELGDGTAGDEPARLLAEAHLLRGRALRALDRWPEVEAAARQARLALSLLPDHVLLPQRYAAEMDIGQAHAGAGRFAAAFAAHARAATRAGQLDDPLAEALARRAMSRDMRGLGRLRDAADQLELALRAARRTGDRTLVGSLAREGLGLLHALGEPPDSPRLQLWRAALHGEA